MYQPSAFDFQNYLFAMSGINQMHIKPVPSEEEIEQILQIVDNNYDGVAAYTRAALMAD